MWTGERGWDQEWVSLSSSPLSAVAEWVMEGGDLEEGEEVPTKKTQTSGRFGRGGEVNLYG